jgi:hypothetical protein
MLPMNLLCKQHFPAAEKRKAGQSSGRTLTRPPLASTHLSTEPGAIMLLPSEESQPFEQRFWLFSNDRAETQRIV